MIRKQYADTRFGQIHLRSAGTPNGCPLVLLHQTASSSVMFEAVMALLAEKYWTIALDTPGFGESFVPEDASVGLYAIALHDAIQALDVTECWLFGHHTGASIAVQMAHDFPELVRKLCLVGPPLMTAEQIAYFEQTLIPFEENGHYVQSVWERTARKSAEISPTLLYREAMLTMQAGPQLTKAYHAVFQQDFAAQLKHITCPTLVTAGENDSLRASLEPTHALLPNSQLHVIADAGTYVCDEQPEVIAVLLQNFFV